MSYRVRSRQGGTGRSKTDPERPFKLNESSAPSQTENTVITGRVCGQRPATHSHAEVLIGKEQQLWSGPG